MSVALTLCDFHEREEHLGFFQQYFVMKRQEAASACLRTMAQYAVLDGLTGG